MELIIVIALLVLVVSFLKRHRSPSASVVFYRLQTRIKDLLDANTEESFVFADAKPKRRRSAAKSFEV